jgi:predicted porin
LVNESGYGATTTKLTGGMQSGSRLGFRGTEDLGSGIKLGFTLETGFNVDNGLANSGGLFGRQVHVGITSAAYGSLTVGRQYGPLYETLMNVGDPFQIGLAGTSGNLFSLGGIRIDNAVKYATPTIDGFSGDVTYGFGEQVGITGAKRTIGGSAGYAAGPLSVRAAYQKNDDALATDSIRTILLAGSYDFGAVKVNAAYAENKGGTTRSHDLLLGASLPFGASKFLVSAIHKDDRSGANNDANQFAIGYIYDLSKRTNVYASYGDISSKHCDCYAIGNASEAGSGERAISLGLRHGF